MIFEKYSMNIDGVVGSRLRMAKKKVQDQGAVNPEECGVLIVRLSDEGCSATQILDFLRSHQY